MNSQRMLQLKALRPEIHTTITLEQTTLDERFQNETIRPIVMLQSDLFIEVFKNYAQKHKNVFYNLTLEKRLDYIENAIQKDMKFRNNLKGMIIGLFTVTEYLQYIKNSSALNKRMMHCVKLHLQNSIQLFETEKAS